MENQDENKKEQKKYKTSEAQRRASRNYNRRNRDYLRVMDYRRKGLTFLEKYSEPRDIVEYLIVVNQRKSELEKELDITIDEFGIKENKSNF